MDPSLITAAQCLPENQFGFDQAALERSILRAEARRALLGGIWSRCRAQIATITDSLKPISRIEFRRKLS